MKNPIVGGEKMPWISLYKPGDSPIHKLNPKTKLAWVIVASVITVTFWNPIPGFILYLALIPVAFAARVAKPFFKRLIIVGPLIAVILLFQTTFAQYAPTIIGRIVIGPLDLPIRYEGLYKGLWLVSLILSVFGWMSILVLTTHPGDLFRALMDLKFPYLASFIVMTALQVVPMMERNLRLCIEAQQSRGHKIGRNPLHIIPIAIPITVSAIERVHKMTWSLEGRAFGSTGKKTSLRHVEMRKVDYVLVILGTALMAVTLIIRGVMGPWYMPPPQTF